VIVPGRKFNFHTAFLPNISKKEKVDLAPLLEQLLLGVFFAFLSNLKSCFLEHGGLTLGTFLQERLEKGKNLTLIGGQTAREKKCLF